MFRQSIKFIIIVVVMLCCVAGCFNKKQSSSQDKALVVCTTGMIADVVKQIAGDKVEVVSLMGPGVDPHLYRPSQGDVEVLNRADLILYNGLHLESKMLSLFNHLSQKKSVLAVSNDLPKDQLLRPEDYEGLYDPHIWFDLNLWEQVISTLSTALIDLQPSDKEFFLSQQSLYMTRFLAVKQETLAYVEQLKQHQRVLVTAHDAFNYFGQFYGFEVKALQGISTQSEAGIDDVQVLVDFIVERKIPAIFVESSISKRHIQAVQAAVKAKGWAVEIGGELFSDALGDKESEAATYLGMVKHNVAQIVDALKK